MTDLAADPVASTVTFRAVLFAGGPPGRWLPAIERLLQTDHLESIVIGVIDPDVAGEVLQVDDRVVVRWAPAFTELVTDAAEGAPRALLVMHAPTILPLQGLGPSLAALSDPRVASVSFLCNAAGYLSFPHRNHQQPYAFEGHDETTLTRALREGDDSTLAPISTAAGPAVLLSSDAVSVAGMDHAFGNRPDVALADLSLRCMRRGLIALLDPSTYVWRPWELGRWQGEVLLDEGTRSELQQRHHFFPMLYDNQRTSDSAPVGLAMAGARAKTEGLRVLVDASSLGPLEMGTQVQILALVDALAARSDVQWVGVGIPGAVPRYADRVLAGRKVRVITTPTTHFEGAEQADIVHRPFQPDRAIPWTQWRDKAARVCVTLQDLIAYQIGAYHIEPSTWLSYREAMNTAVHRADGTIVISHDVANQVRAERMPVERDRLFVVPNGTDHLRGDEPEEFPAEVLSRGWTAAPFLVVLGADYSHKNRDLAMRVWRLLRERGHRHNLVLAGVTVAQGSSRAMESTGRPEPGVLRLPDVTSEERNWLLRHADLCLYPTSAEGFGLVPFEAASFGTATVHARFGPLAEVLGKEPVTAETWRPEELADAAERLLVDPDLRAEQIAATIASGERYTWEATATQLVAAYRRLLAQPARS